MDVIDHARNELTRNTKTEQVTTDATGTYAATIAQRDRTTKVDSTLGVGTLTLPNVGQMAGRMYSVLATTGNTNAVTVQDNDESVGWGDRTLNGANMNALFYSDGLRIHQVAEWPLQFVAIGVTGYSYNLIDVTASAAANLRGLRVNVRSGDNAVGDLQCVHGYLDVEDGATINANAAVYPLSAWLNITDGATHIAAGNVICGLRVIVDVNSEDLTSLAGGGESALIYAQTWAGTGSIDEGLRLVIGAGTTITQAISLGGTGTAGRILEWTELGNGEQELMLCGTQDAQVRNIRWFMGHLATRAAIRAQVGDLLGMGSMYFSSAGEAYIKVAGATADTDWEVISHAALDTG